MESTGNEDLAIAFEFRCDVKWKEMQVVGAARERRRCDVCERTVHLCGTLAEFDQHARLGNCVAVYEYGPFARITANSPEAPDAAEDLPLSEKPFDPFAPDAVTPSAPRPPSHPLAPGPLPPLYVDLPFEVDLPTAGMPRLPENGQRAPKA